MSFTNDVKKDILTYEYNDEELKAELYGILKLKLELIIRFDGISAEIKTASLNISRRLIYLVKKIYKINIELKAKARANLDHNNIYYVTINDSVQDMLIDLQLVDEYFNYIDEVPSIYDGYESSVIRGFFLAKGSINEPSKARYHLEISCKSDSEVDFIINALNKIDINGKKANRRNNVIFYIKKVEQIVDFLKYLNAFNTMFEFEDSRIKRDMINTVNRCMNCDIANSIKSQKSIEKQFDDIKIIDKYLGLATLSPRLLEAIMLRTENPDASLSELSMMSEEVIGRFISKSGLSHCFHDIADIANSFRNN
ncbi:MAG: DNA-binding protein WhiA [Bacilli bacterium]|nr:DNA-binding protein WhiA [Bacilli bacterium]